MKRERSPFDAPGRPHDAPGLRVVRIYTEIAAVARALHSGAWSLETIASIAELPVKTTKTILSHLVAEGHVVVQPRGRLKTPSYMLFEQRHPHPNARKRHR